MRSRRLLVVLTVVLVFSMLLSSCAKPTATPVPPTPVPPTEVPVVEEPAVEEPAVEEPTVEAEAVVEEAAAAVAEEASAAVAVVEEKAEEAAAVVEEKAEEAVAAVEEEVTAAAEVVEEKAEEAAAAVAVVAAPVAREDDGEIKTMTWSLGATDIPTIDPAISTDTSSNQVNGLVFAGIMNQNEVTAEFENGMATEVVKGEVAEDGTVTYTYKLRTDVPWVHYNAETEMVEYVKDCDGNPRYVTANDFEYAIKRTANPATASDYAFMITGYVVGAAEYFAGEGEADGVAVKAVDAETLEITFLKDIAPNTMIPGLWVTYATPQWLIEGDACTEAAADRWIEPENVQTYGPYAVKEWFHDDHLTIVQNPYWPADVASIPAPKIDEVEFRILDSSAALAEFEAGNLMGINDVPVAELDRIKADETMGKELSIGENFCTYFYGFNTTKPFVDDARVRRALSMAIDRQSLIDNVVKGGQVPAQWFSRPGLLAAPTLADYPDLGIKYDVEGAKAELQSYMDEKGITDPAEISVEIMFNTSENHQKIAVAIQQMWKDVLGINATVQNQEWAVYLKTIRGADTPQVFRLGWCQDYPDAANFVDDQASSGGSSNPTVDGKAGSAPEGGFMWYNQEFEDLVNAALVSPDTAERTDLYAQAEEILVKDDAAMAPIYWYTSVQLCKINVDRTYSVMGGKEAFNKWDILPEGEERAVN